MPLLMCPNCNASMNEVSRHEVKFDMCPSCRGVWLDRGELEKIIAGVQAEPTAPAPAAQAYQQRQPRHDDDRRGDHDDDYGRNERGRRRKRGGFDLLDIFD